MPLRPIAIGLASALFALAAGASAASAATAYASSTVNVRAGAGTGYAVVGVLRPGQRVEIDYCKGAWCLIEQRGPDGWVNANYLNADRYRDRDYYDDDYYDDYDDGFYLERPRYRARPIYPFYRSQACFGRPNVSFCFSN
ncbi:SH3 domain-containing protein [Devosia sp. LjRoot16]|uniref:SH3 domain-containing protein n=1 Tax=Devosia sp. LjRoot16 TaxID=3342271 RepID=UPI003ECC6EEF